MAGVSNAWKQNATHDAPEVDLPKDETSGASGARYHALMPKVGEHADRRERLCTRRCAH